MQLVEARLTWGSDLLGVAHVRAPRGRGGEMRIADFGLPFPADAAFSLAELPRTFVEGNCILHLALADTPRPVPAARSDGRVAKGVALGFVLHATFLAMAYIGRGTDAELERAELEALKAMLDEQMPKRVVAKVELPFMPEDAIGTSEVDANGESAKPGEEGAMGNPASQRSAGIRARAHGEHPHEIDRRPEPSIESFGMIALLSENGYGRNAGNDAFASNDGPNAMGSIFGRTIDDAIGVGGLGLSSFGEGGGGKGAGVDLEGGGGTCGPDCVGMFGRIGHTGQGFSVGVGRLAGGHTTRAPVLRCGQAEEAPGGCATQVNGRLPPEAVQRVVRQSFGRLRGCYEAGIQRNPSLEGRIAVKFVIDRAGAVSFASVSDRDLPDDEVARCVARGFMGMTFPEPAGGIVTVVYPIVFSTSP